MARHASREPHAALGVRRGASRDEITRAFRSRARHVHPDVSGSDTTSEMADLSAARDALLKHASADHAPTGHTPAHDAEPRERPAGAASHEPAWTDHWAAWNEPRRHDP